MKHCIKNFIFILLMLGCFPLFAAQKLLVLLDWLPNAGHAPLFVARDQGFYQEQGLDVELLGPANPADPPKLVAARKADMAITYEPQLMEQIDQGLPLVRVGTLVNQPLDCLVALKESGIKKISDLKGKSIGVSLGGMSNITLKTMLQKHGLTLKDVKQINVHYNLTQSLLSKKIDAVTGMMRTFEVIQLQLMGESAQTFFPEENGVPTYSELVFVVHKNNQNDPRFLKFLFALQKGVVYLQQHPEESWKLFAKNHPELNNDLNHKAWFASIPYFSNNPADFNKKEWLDFANFLFQNGLIKKVQNIDSYAIDLNKP